MKGFPGLQVRIALSIIDNDNHKVLPSSLADTSVDLGYEKRAVLYELHHALNHYNLFGAGYQGSCLSLMRKIISNLH